MILLHTLSYFAVQYATIAVQSVCISAPPPAYKSELKNISSKYTVCVPPSTYLKVLKFSNTST